VRRFEVEDFIRYLEMISSLSINFTIEPLRAEDILEVGTINSDLASINRLKFTELKEEKINVTVR